MPRIRPWRTAAFRLAVAIAAVFVVGGVALLALFHVAISHYAEESIRQSLRGEMARTQGGLMRRGPYATARRIGAIMRAGGERRSYILLSNPTLRLQVGDLPASAGQRLGYGRLTLRREDGEPVKLITLAQRSPPGTLVVIGRDTEALDQFRERLIAFSFWGGAALILLGLTAGLAASVVFTRSLEQVNAAASRIMQGRLDERLPPIGFGDEFARLTQNLNLMLDRLQAAMTALRQVSADVAHDLRTPLTRLRNSLEQAGAEAPDASPVHTALAETDGILQLFDALVRIAQLEGGSARHAFQPVDLSAAVEHVVGAYQPEAEDGQRTLASAIEGGVTVQGDGALLRQLLANLIENALVHTPPGSSVRVSLGRRGGSAVLRVVDDGPGVPAAEREKIAQRFYRLDRSRTTPGAGLGLALASAIVEAHGGSIRFLDADPGLIVEVELPIPAAEA